MKTCLKVEPASSSTGKQFNSSQRMAALAQVRCLREHGMPNFPDPTFPASGGELFPTIVGFNPRVTSVQTRRSRMWAQAVGRAAPNQIGVLRILTGTGHDLLGAERRARWVAMRAGGERGGKRFDLLGERKRGDVGLTTAIGVRPDSLAGRTCSGASRS